MRKTILVLSVSLLGIMLVTAPAAAQMVDPSNSPAENVRTPGARRPGLMVQAGIAARNNGADITAPAPPDPQFVLTLLNEFLRNLFAQLTALADLLPTILQPPGAGAGAGPGPGLTSGGGSVNDIVMTEIAHDGNVALVELLNRSPIRISLDGWAFSDGNLVSPSLPPLEIERDMTLVVQMGGETQNPNADLVIGFRLQSINAGELALYDFSNAPPGSMPIDDPNFMIDYVQWNNDTQQRDPPLEQVASAANLWTTVDAIPSALTNRTFRLRAGAESRTSSASRDFIVDDFSANNLGVPESQLAPVTTPPAPVDTGDNRNIRDRLR